MGDNNKKLEKLKYLLEEFLSLLYENKGQNYVSGVKGLLGILYDESCPLEERLEEVKWSYRRQMMRGAGSLADFAIWHEDEKTRLDRNQYLEKVQNEIWELLDCDLSNLPSVEEGYPPGHIYWSIKDPK